MTISASIRQSSSLGGVSFGESQTLTADGQIVHDVSVPAAQTGDLSTRTSDTQGEITMDESAHTITTGARVCLFWAGGSRRDVTVGTVSGADVPFSGGLGDALPIATTEIFVSLPEELDIFVDGDNVVAALASFAKEGIVEFIDTDASEQEIVAWNVGEGGVKMWHNADGDDNPFTAANIGRLYVSHKDAAAATVKIGIAYDNVAG